MFGFCKNISGKYSNFQKCYFSEGKMFSCVWLQFKIFFEKYFLVFRKEVGKEEGRSKTQKNPNKPKRTRRDLAIDSAISRSVDRSSSRSFSLSFSLCASSLCASPVPEIIWSENRNGNEFLWSTLLFYGQLKMISRKFNFPNQPNSLFYEKWFLETIFTKNKHSLIKKLLKIKKNWDSVW